MDRMKTLLLYALGIVGFMVLSFLLEESLVQSMYERMDGTIIPTDYNIGISDVLGEATNVNGNMSFKLTNNSSDSENLYVKIDLYSKQGLLAATQYVPITDLAQGESKEYQVNFKGNEIEKYNLSIVNEVPDKSNIISILGWEIDLSNIFGLDLSDATLFGVKVKDIFTWDNAKTAAGNAWDWTLNIVQSVPWWAYVIATGIVVWYLPSGYLFGII